MKKLLFSGLFLLGTMCTHAQAIFSADFENLTGWTFRDLDGDGFIWKKASLQQDSYGFKAGGIVYSASFDDASSQTLTPDNLLISPSIVLPSNKAITLKYQIGALDEGYFQEHYAVYVLEDGKTFVGNEVPVKEETLTAVDSKIVTANISSYAGKTVRLIFRHYQSTDEHIIALDNVSVESGAQLGINETQDLSQKLKIVILESGNLKIFSEAKVLNAEIIDAQGRMVKYFADAVEADVKNLKSGMYFIKVVTDQGIMKSKFIKK